VTRARTAARIVHAFADRAANGVPSATPASIAAHLEPLELVEVHVWARELVAETADGAALVLDAEDIVADAYARRRHPSSEGGA
jgi:hypothetical protein